MPRFRYPEDEPRTTGGAGHLARTGLGRFRNKETAGQDDGGYDRAPKLPVIRKAEPNAGRQDRCTGGQDRCERGDLAVRKTPAGQGKNREHRLIENLRAQLPEIMASFERLSEGRQEPLKLTTRQIAVRDSLLRQPFIPHNFLEKNTGFYFCIFDLVDHPELLAPKDRIRAASEFKAGFAAGTEAMKTDWNRAFDIFAVLTSAYLNDPHGSLPTDLGEEALANLRIISRAWVGAHAAERAIFDITNYQKFFDPHPSMGRILWSNLAIAQLGIIGGIQDLAALGIIGRRIREGHVEIACSTAANQIITREGLRLALAAIPVDERIEIGILPGLTDSQLVQRLGYLMDALGLVQIISNIPSIRRFGSFSFGPVMPMMASDSLARLLKDRLDQKFMIEPLNLGDLVNGEGTMYAKIYLRQAGIIEAADEGAREFHHGGQYRLSETGVLLIQRVMREIFGLQDRRQALAVEPAKCLPAPKD